MRPPTPEEEQRWAMLIRTFEHCSNKPSRVELGRFHVWDVREGQITVRLITPLLAGFYTEDLRPKVPPIRFDRTPDGWVIIPGRWWQWALETMSEMEQHPPDFRRTASWAAQGIDTENTLLPPTTETIVVMAPNDRGDLVLYEALPPETLMELHYFVETQDEGER